MFTRYVCINSPAYDRPAEVKAAIAERRARTENPLSAATAELIAALVGNGTYELVPVRRVPPRYTLESAATLSGGKVRAIRYR